MINIKYSIAVKLVLNSSYISITDFITILILYMQYTLQYGIDAVHKIIDCLIELGSCHGPGIYLQHKARDISTQNKF